MSSVRKRIGGGWKTVDVSAKYEHDSTKSEMSSAIENNEIEKLDKHEITNRGDTKRLIEHPRGGRMADNDKSAVLSNNEHAERRRDSSDSEEHEYKRKLDEQHTEKHNKAKIDRRGISESEEGSAFDIGEKNYGCQEKNGDGSFLQLPEIAESLSRMSRGSDGEAKRLQLGEKTESHDVDYDDYPILRRVQDSVIGHDLVISAPYGPRKVTYCDFTASGRCVSFIEDFIRRNVFPTYANTHSTTGHNARQTGKYREEARNIIKQCTNTNKDDVVVFTGSGATAGIHKVAWALKMNIPRVATDTAVFIGPYEHHSNILLWREFGTKVIRIRHNKLSGMTDLEHLNDELKFWKERRRCLLVCMSAASNVTGIITDVDAVARLAHNHGALAIFDYAGGGPYLKIDMNPSKGEYKDAVILSPHKFVGGPGTPGLVVAKKWLFKNTVPDRVGGGTVRFVTRETHSYIGNIEEREEGGTPAIIESIRAGIVFQLKEAIGTDLIHAREVKACRRAFEVWEKNPAIFVLGSHTASRVPIFSFLTIHQETGRLIHHNFISSLLSDLYGIQARGGCACAGPYAEDLMGISEHMAKKYMWFLAEKPNWKHSYGSSNVPLEIMKPGFTRINLAYFIDDETVEFVIQAVDMVTKYGWKLLPQYSFDLKSASWHHKSFANTTASKLMSLQHAISETHIGSPDQAAQSNKAPSYKEVLKAAEELYTDADSMYTRSRISSASLTLRDSMPKDKRGLKWFLTPYEATHILTDTDKTYLERKPYRLPFKLQKPSFCSDSETESDYHSDTEGSRVTARSGDTRLPSIGHRRARATYRKRKSGSHGYTGSQSLDRRRIHSQRDSQLLPRVHGRDSSSERQIMSEDEDITRHKYGYRQINEDWNTEPCGTPKRMSKARNGDRLSQEFSSTDRMHWMGVKSKGISWGRNGQNCVNCSNDDDM